MNNQKILEIGTAYKANANGSLAIIIPKSIVKYLKIKQGTRVLMRVKNGTIFLEFIEGIRK